MVHFSGDLHALQHTSPLHNGLPNIPHRNHLAYIYSFNVILHLTIAMKIQSPLYSLVLMNILCIPATMLQYNVNLFVGYRERYGMCCIRKWKAVFKIFAFKSTCLKQTEYCKHARTPTLYIHFPNLLTQYWQHCLLILFEKCFKSINFNAIHFSHLCILLFMSEITSLIIF
jgi:hypothetical protein